MVGWDSLACLRSVLRGNVSIGGNAFRGLRRSLAVTSSLLAGIVTYNELAIFAEAR
jgi:hypothetical protein